MSREPSPGKTGPIKEELVTVCGMAGGHRARAACVVTGVLPESQSVLPSSTIKGKSYFPWGQPSNWSKLSRRPAWMVKNSSHVSLNMNSPLGHGREEGGVETGLCLVMPVSPWLRGKAHSLRGRNTCFKFYL